MSSRINIIENTLHNTLDKLKGVIRKGKPIPPVNDIYHWFTTISPIKIKTDHLPLVSFVPKKAHFESIFFFNGLKVYLMLSYRHTTYRGHPFIDFNTEIYFLDNLNLEDYMDSEKIKYLQNNFDIKIH